ncbi:MAG: chemotaxis protein CheW [Planctomycetota bacterium]|jgi:purine-binding chemotaxis protein CheW
MSDPTPDRPDGAAGPPPEDDAAQPASEADAEAFDSRAIIERMRQDYWQNLATPPEGEPTAISTVVSFDVGPGLYGVDVEQVREVLKMPWVSRLPRTPDFLLGVVNVRGRILPVLDLRPLLAHQPRAADRDTRLISVRVGEAEVCLKVDRVGGLTEFANDTVHPPPTIASGVPRELIGGQVEIGDRLLALVEVGPLLDHCAAAIGGVE